MQASFLEQMRAKRRALKLNQADFAELAGIPERTYQDYEAGKRPIPSDRLEAIARALGCTVADLYADPSKPPPNTMSELAFGDSKAIVERLDAIERKLPINFTHGKDAEIDNLKARIRYLEALIGPHEAILEALNDKPALLVAVEAALGLHRQDARLKKKAPGTEG